MRRRSSLVCQFAENISGEILAKFPQTIRTYIHSRNGIYALYSRGKLYYVGLARNLTGRLKQHLKDRHAKKWDRFSVYLTIDDSHMKELESLLLRIIKPKGNRNGGGFARSENLRRRLARDIRHVQKQEYFDLIRKLMDVEPNAPRRTRHKPDNGADQKRPVLADYIDGPIRLQRQYKGKLHRARVRSNGSIRYGNKVYNSPSLAAAAVTRCNVNGWTFWRFELRPHNWVRLCELKRR